MQHHRRDLIGEPGRAAAVLCCDNRPGLVCAAMVGWVRERAGLHFIWPSGPWRDGCAGSFSSRIRDECLNTGIFWSWPGPAS